MHQSSNSRPSFHRGSPRASGPMTLSGKRPFHLWLCSSWAGEECLPEGLRCLLAGGPKTCGCYLRVHLPSCQGGSPRWSLDLKQRFQKAKIRGCVCSCGPFLLKQDSSRGRPGLTPSHSHYRGGPLPSGWAHSLPRAPLAPHTPKHGMHTWALLKGPALTRTRRWVSGPVSGAL